MLQPSRASNPVRRGRFNSRLMEEAGLVAGDASPAPGGGSDPPTVQLADLRQDVLDYAAANPGDFANHCINFDFLDGLVLALQAIDVRVGFCWRPDRQDYAQDALTYYHGALPPVEDSPNVYVVDVIINKCSIGAAPAWNDVTTPARIRMWREFRI
jgi:hypothetical protein